MEKKSPMTSEQAEPLMQKSRDEFREWKTANISNKNGFFPIYNDFLEKGALKELSGNALKLYIYLGIHSKNDTGESWHSSERIAEYFNCDKRTISRWFKELEEKELIFRVQKGYKRSANTFLRPY